MIFSANAKSLLAAAVRASKILKKKNAQILLEASAERGGVDIKSTNLDTADCYFFVAAEVTEDGAVQLDGRRFGSMLKPTGDEDVRVSKQSNGRLLISSDSYEFEIPTLAADEHPILAFGGSDDGYRVETSALLGPIKSALYAASRDETRYNLNGVRIEADDTNDRKLTFIATDGHRLSVRASEGDENKPLSVIVGAGLTLPTVACELLADMIEGVDDVTMQFVDDRVLFVQLPDCGINLRVVPGDFPAWRQVVPKPTARSRVSRKVLSQAIRNMSSAIDGKESPLAFARVDDVLSLKTSNPDSGEARCEVAAEGDQLPEFALSGRYVVDALATLEGDEVEVGVIDQLSPIVFTGENNVTAVIMPMRL